MCYMFHIVLVKSLLHLVVCYSALHSTFLSTLVEYCSNVSLLYNPKSIHTPRRVLQGKGGHLYALRFNTFSIATVKSNIYFLLPN